MTKGQFIQIRKTFFITLIINLRWTFFLTCALDAADLNNWSETGFPSSCECCNVSMWMERECSSCLRRRETEARRNSTGKIHQRSRDKVLTRENSEISSSLGISRTFLLFHFHPFWCPSSIILIKVHFDWSNSSDIRRIYAAHESAERLSKRNKQNRKKTSALSPQRLHTLRFTDA